MLLKRRIFCLSSSVLPLIASAQVHAQTETRRDDGLQEIVVTAQRRAEPAQGVPIAITALSGDQMAKAGLQSTADLTTVIPGLTMVPTGGRSPMFLRGVGNNGTSTSPSVLTFIDGVYQPFDGSGLDFSNIQSIEVAKGPQGTLFGRNATGGVLQVTTRNPFDWQGVDLQVGYANYDEASGKIYASARLSDAVAIDFAGHYTNQASGWGTNFADNSEFFTAKRTGLRSKLVLRPDDSFTATLTGHYSYRRGNPGTTPTLGEAQNFLFNPVTGTTYTYPSLYDVNADHVPFFRRREAGVALTLDKQLGDLKLLSISSYQTERELVQADYDGTEFPVFHITAHSRRHSLTQELQASGSSNRLSWVAGLYYYRMRAKFAPFQFSGIGPSQLPPVGFGTAPGTPYALLPDDHTDAYAAYVQATYEFLPQTNLTLGARYTIEKRQLSGETTGSPFISPTSAGTLKATFKKPNFRVALDHKFTPTVLGYASWTRGFNAGLFNQFSVLGYTPAVNPVVKPEEIDSYEIGIKSDLLNRRLRVNLAAFRYDYNNLQQQIYEFGATTLLNAAGARIKGVDLEVVARPVRDLTLSVSASYLDAKYRSYPLAVDYDLLPNGALVAVGARNAAGKRLVNSPEFALQASASHTLRTGIGTFETTANLNYQGRVYGDPQNEIPLFPRTIVGLTEQWTSPDEQTYASVWVKNLTNKAYDVGYNILAPVGALGIPAAPRTYGVTLGRKF